MTRVVLRSPSAADLELAAQLHEVTGLPVVVRPREERREPITLPAPAGRPCGALFCGTIIPSDQTRCERHKQAEASR